MHILDHFGLVHNPLITKRKEQKEKEINVVKVTLRALVDSGRERGKESLGIMLIELWKLRSFSVTMLH